MDDLPQPPFQCYISVNRAALLTIIVYIEMEQNVPKQTEEITCFSWETILIQWRN